MFKLFPVFFLVLTGLLIVCWSLKPRSRIYEFPFFTSLGFLGLIAPQGIGLYNDPYPVSIAYIDLTILLAIFCLMAAWLGYVKTQPSVRFLSKFNREYSVDKLFYFGIVYVIIGFIFNILISGVPEEQLNESQWTGILTIYFFFSRLLYLGFALIFIATLRTPSKSRWYIVILSSFWPVFKLLFLARRTESIIFFCIILIAIFFVRGYVLPLYIMLIMLLFGALAINTIGVFRSELSEVGIGLKNWTDFFNFNWIDDWISAIRRVDWWQAFQNEVIKSDVSETNKSVTSELKFAASVIEVTNHSWDFGLGSSYWNTLINRYIPAQLVGKSLKFALQIPTPNIREKIFEYYKFQTFSTGFTLPLMADIFFQFWFLGLLVYYWLASMMKFLWMISVVSKNIIFQVLYVLIIPFTTVAVFAGLGNFIAECVYYSVFLIPVDRYTRVVNKN
jgi:hypothetical protein